MRKAVERAYDEFYVATAVTFEYEMNTAYHDVDVFGSIWKDVLKGVFQL